MSAQMQVLFATTDIARNEAISEANSKILPIEIQNYDQIMLKQIPAGKLAKNNIKAGTPIRQNNILSPKDVLRGDELIVEIRDGGVSVQTTGIATTDANIGDVIEIRMGSTRQKAQITAKNKAVIK
ncbi:flagellar basal body P-ring formation chaperone FlgA [Campylobacter sp.]|nr:flagellar basal body P-ring formation chaperone FlgA [Campylobacter sp.]MCI7237418.1 flagellar basal body P-ring formation chaperone FlgA [Campylobacter sp.]